MKITLILILFSFSVFAEPSWIGNVEKECDKNEICQVGSGDSVSTASRDARENIAKYFEVEINSKFESNVSSDGEGFNESNSASLGETTNGILKATTIKETYQDGKIYYAFAVLDKNKVSNELKKDIQKIDTEMSVLYKDKKSQNSIQLQRLYKQRAELNKKYMFLTDKSIPEKVKYEDIYKKTKEGNNLIYYINFKNISVEREEIKNIIANAVTENGNLVSDTKENTNRTIEVSVNTKKEFLNVDGFVKYKVLYRLQSKKGNVAIGLLTKSFVETGRSEEQVVEKTNEQFKEYLDENLDKLLQ